jgi:hypothetical protein
MKRFAVVLALLVSGASWAQGIDGWGRISAGGGFRWVPNWWFQEKSAALDRAMIPTIDGGGQGTASFGLGVSSMLEISVDLVLGYQTFALHNPDGDSNPYTSLTAGALLGGRLVGTDVFFKGFMPYLSLQAGPVLSAISSHDQMVPEKVNLGLSAAGGATVKIGDRYGFTLEVRYLQARNAVPGISGINVGGVWFTAMFTYFFAPALKRDLDVPGF